jgi:predicted nucleic acid-binding Zn ribbon protein
MASRKKRESSEPDRVGDILGGLLHKLGISEEVARQEVLLRWDSTVGEKIASVSKAVAVSGGVLFVHVESSAWMNELNLMRYDIMKRLNAGAGECRIDRIVFTLSDGSGGVDRNPRNR